MLLILLQILFRLQISGGKPVKAKTNRNNKELDLIQPWSSKKSNGYIVLDHVSHDCERSDEFVSVDQRCI